MMKILLTLFLIFFSSAAYADIVSGLVGHWRLNEGTGSTAYDSSGQASNGALANSPTWITGHLSNALSFNGTNYVSIPVTGTQFAAYPLSVCFWAKTTVSSSYSSFVKRVLGAQGFNILIDAANTFGIRIDDSGANNHTIYPATPAINDGNWHFCAVTITSGGLVTVYSDGVSRGFNTFASGFSLTGGDFGIPSGNDTGIGTGVSTNASIDDVRVYNRALSAADVAQLYNMGPAKLSHAHLRNFKMTN